MVSDVDVLTENDGRTCGEIVEEHAEGIMNHLGAVRVLAGHGASCHRCRATVDGRRL